MMAYTKEQQLTLWGLDPALTGLILGGVFVVFALAADAFFSKFSLQQFNTLSLGLLFGYLFSLALTQSTLALFSSLNLNLPKGEQDLILISLTLLSLYLGLRSTLRAASNWRLSLPFIELSNPAMQSKKILMDSSCLSDPRLIDLCSSGLLDQRLVLSKTVLKDLSAQLQNTDEQQKARAKQGLENAKKLENNKSLDLQLDTSPLSEGEDLLKLARRLDAYLLTSESNQISNSNYEDIKVINLNQLSHALKPLMQAGESIKIKIQRVGKEAMQGVGYLEDGAMVVVNGGGEFVGQIVEAQVLSVKHTSSGRIIFCNLSEDSALLVSKQTSPYTKGQGKEQEKESPELALSKASGDKPSQQIKNLKDSLFHERSRN